MAKLYPKSVLSTAFNKPPEGAVEYLGSKVVAPSFNWYDYLGEANTSAFTVAKATQADVLESIHSALKKSLEKGETFTDFQKNLTPKLTALGWWGKDKNGNITGSPHRLKTIFRTNIQQSYNAGREKKIQRGKKFRPFAEYVAVLDSQTRPTHRTLDGTIAEVDSSFWSYYTPSNGFNCRCRKRTLSLREIERLGLKVTNFDDRISFEEQTINKSKGITAKSAVVTINGKKFSPDPGFSNNPLDSWKPNLKKYNDIPSVKKELKKDLKRAVPESEKKTRRQLAEKEAKKRIKEQSKPKTYDQALSDSQEFNSQWEKKFPPAKTSLDKAEGSLKVNGVNIRGSKEELSAISKAMKKRSFRSQAKSINELRSNPSVSTSTIEKIQVVLANTVKKVRKVSIDSEAPAFKNVRAGKVLRVGSDLINIKAGKEAIKKYLSFSTAKEQISYLNKIGLDGSEKNGLSTISYISLLDKSKKSISDYVKSKSNFLGGALQNSKLGKEFDPLEINTRFNSSNSPFEINSINEKRRRAGVFYEKNLAPELIPRDAIKAISISKSFVKSSYTPSKRKITYSKHMGADVLIHEMAHHLHSSSPRIQSMIEEFFERRTKGDKLLKSMKYSNMTYLKDNFIDEYIGKVYSSGLFARKTFDHAAYKKFVRQSNLGDEVLSEGFQRFFADKDSLYASDPEYFELISAILRGIIPE